MLKYENMANLTISVNLQNDYSVIAMADWNKKNKNYNVTFYLKRDDINILDLMEKQENVEFNSNLKSIKTDVAKYITNLLTDGFFKYYIERYEYEQKCFDKGNEFYESERLGNQ